MTRRLYFLVPDVETARRIVDELLLARIEERSIHVIAKADIPLEDLPEAGLSKTSDLVKSIERGGAIGGAAGLLAGLMAVAVPPAGVILGGGAVILLSTLAGAGVGAWASSLIGVSVPNTELKRFQNAVESGQILMLVDVPSDREDEIKALIERHHPEVNVAGTEPTKPAFP